MRLFQGLSTDSDARPKPDPISVVAWIGAEMEFALSQAVASGDAFEHRPSECGHCVQDFLADLDFRDLPGEAAGFELGADHALPTVGSRAECGRITAYFGGCMTTSRVTLLHREKNTDGQERR